MCIRGWLKVAALVKVNQIDFCFDLACVPWPLNWRAMSARYEKMF